jgi:hypothetical protein
MALRLTGTEGVSWAHPSTGTVGPLAEGTQEIGQAIPSGVGWDALAHSFSCSLPSGLASGFLCVPRRKLARESP